MSNPLIRARAIAAIALGLSLASPVQADTQSEAQEPRKQTNSGAAQGIVQVPPAQQAGGAPMVGAGQRAAGTANAAPVASGAASATTAGEGTKGGTAVPGAGAANQNLDGEPLPSPRIDFVKTAVDGVAPLDAPQIRKLKEEIDKRQGAESTPVRSDLIPVSVTYDIDLSPGARPQVVQVTPGQGALVNIIDREGNGWPIKSVKNYNESAILVEQMGSNTLSISGVSNHQIASVGVLLEGLNVAWSFTVIPAQVTTDVRVDLRLPSLSPGSVTKVGRATGIPSVGAKLDGYLYGGTPEGARRLDVVGLPSARAWQSPNGRLVLRLQGLVSSPAWYERMPAADGTAVYELPATPVVAVATDDGISHTLRIKGLQPTVASSELRSRDH
jgi:intracellular multiplication protein IcmK